MKKYKIIGKDLRYAFEECYGRFDELSECLKYLNSLKYSTMSTHTKFYYKEVK